MTILPTHSDAASPLSMPAAPTAPDASFAQAMQEADRAGRDGRPEEIRDAAEKLVASAFIMPLLEQVRESAKENDLFYGGTGEDLFGQQMDTQLADNIVHSSRLPIVDAVYQQFARHAGLGEQVNTHG